MQREYAVRDSVGEFVARVDLAVPLVRLGIEGHSREHHITPDERAYDERRDNRAAEAGWDIRYVGFADATRSPAQVRAYIERLVDRRARDLRIRLPTDA